MGNCLIMHVVYFERLIMVYRVVGSTMGNQDSTGYLFSCQLSGLYLDYDATLVVFSCRAMVFSYESLAACPDSVLEELDRGIGHARYPFKTHALH